jgi:hypothetical protein
MVRPGDKKVVQQFFKIEVIAINAINFNIRA